MSIPNVELARCALSSIYLWWLVGGSETGQSNTPLLLYTIQRAAANSSSVPGNNRNDRSLRVRLLHQNFPILFADRSLRCDREREHLVPGGADSVRKLSNGTLHSLHKFQCGDLKLGHVPPPLT